MPADNSRATRLALPSCRNYWRLYDNLPKVHAAVITSDNTDPKYNKNSKRRHQLDLMDDESVSDFRYRIRESLNPTPFRGIAMISFWLFFALILVFIAVMILTLLYVGMLSESQKDEHDALNNQDINRTSSIILKTLLDHQQ
jgi:hypothetical protein